MRLLFVHQNFPGQYRHLAAHYAEQPGYKVVALGEKANLVRQPRIPGVSLMGYELGELKSKPFEAPVLKAIHRGKRVAAGAATGARASVLRVSLPRARRRFRFRSGVSGEH